MQILLNGIVAGLNLALFSLGFLVVYGPCRVFYLSLAGVYCLAPYIAMAALEKGASPAWAFLGAVLVGVLVSMGIELANHGPLSQKNASSGIHFIASLGAYIVIVEIVALVWGNETQVLSSGVDSVYELSWGLLLTRAQGVSLLFSFALLGCFYGWLRLSSLGLRLRALTENPNLLAIFGFNTKKLRLMAFGISGLLGSVSALLAANDVGFEPHGGLHVLLLAVIAMVVGGSGSFLAPIVGGVLLGITRAFVVWQWSSAWQDAVAFCLLALFLLIRPRGILGPETRLEARS